MRESSDSYLVTFVVPVNNDKIFENNFLASPLFLSKHPHQILIQRNYFSAAKAYNDAIDNTLNDLMVFAHQDVLFPEFWLEDLEKALKYLDQKDAMWGVLGCFGVTQDGKEFGYLYCTGNGRILGSPFEKPQPVQTLDEMVLILRKSSELRFNDSLPGFHFYGTDICMSAAKKGRKCYAISAFLVHNSNQFTLFSRDFLIGYKHVKACWHNFLPIRTTCTTIERYNLSFYYRYSKRLVHAFLRIIGAWEKSRIRVKDPNSLLKQIETKVGN